MGTYRMPRRRTGPPLVTGGHAAPMLRSSRRKSPSRDAHGSRALTSAGAVSVASELTRRGRREWAASVSSPLISTLAAPWRPAPNMVSSPGSPARVRRGPVPRSLSARPGDAITIVAGTIFAIPPGPTRAHSASANSVEIVRGSQPSCARRTSSTWTKNSTVFIGPSKGRSRAGGPRRTVSTSLSTTCGPAPRAVPCRYIRPAEARRFRVHCRASVHGRPGARPDPRWTNPRTTSARRGHARRRGRRESCAPAEQG